MSGNPFDRETDGIEWLKAEQLLREERCRAMGGCTPACRARIAGPRMGRGRR